MKKDDVLNDLKPLHPRAIRIALERVLEHEQFQCSENGILKSIYTHIFETEKQSKLQKNLARLDLSLFHQLKTDTERDRFVLDWYRAQRRDGIT